MTKEIKQTNSKPKRLSGVVVSDRADKTVVVLVERYEKHPKYHKFVKQSKRYKAHDAENKHVVGEKVTIEECKPLSKDKTFRVISQ